MSKLEVYSHGVVYCSICTDIGDVDEIEKRVNRINPTMIESQWVVSGKPFRTGHPNPNPCGDKEGFKHYLMEC